MPLEFTVIDKKTGEYPDVEKIALKEEWAKNLIYCDIDSFAIMEDGTLVLIDDCGNIAYAPKDRFEIRLEPKEPKTKADQIRSMSDEEMAEELLSWFNAFYFVECGKDDVLEVLKEEVT